MTIQEANQLINKYVRLRDKKNKNDQLKLELKKQEKLCVEKFKYLVLIKTNRYKQFNNYEDLVQEGTEALLKALYSYKPSKGANVFWWLHKYIDTRIARCANLHTAIRFPLKYAKEHIPHREPFLPVLIDRLAKPSDLLEQQELLCLVKKSFNNLSKPQKQVVQMLFGINGEAPRSITKICKQLHMSRESCNKILNQALNVLRKNIKV